MKLLQKLHNHSYPKAKELDELYNNVISAPNKHMEAKKVI